MIDVFNKYYVHDGFQLSKKQSKVLKKKLAALLQEMHVETVQHYRSRMAKNSDRLNLSKSLFSALELAKDSIFQLFHVYYLEFDEAITELKDTQSTLKTILQNKRHILPADKNDIFGREFREEKYNQYACVTQNCGVAKSLED